MRGVGLACAMMAMGVTPVAAQMRTIDPNQASGLAAAAPRASAADEPPPPPPPAEGEPAPVGAPASAGQPVVPEQPTGTTAPPPATSAELQARASAENTYRQQDVLTAADGVFGKGASGLANLLERLFREQGQPSAYIAGHEAGGAFVVGLRYGSGTLFHKVEGQRPVHWTGPSLGFDFGGSASKVFVLVYNLYDSQELYRRFPAAEGQVYVVGGFTASYLRWKDVVLIPIRLGVGWRLGANLGYMNFTEKMRLLPF